MGTNASDRIRKLKKEIQEEFTQKSYLIEKAQQMENSINEKLNQLEELEKEYTEDLQGMTEEEVKDRKKVLQDRIDRGGAYLDEIYYKKDRLSPTKLKESIEKREKHIPLYMDLVKEYDKCKVFLGEY